MYQLLTDAEVAMLDLSDPVLIGEEKKLPKQQKCKYCSKQATKRVIHSEGMAYIPACITHLDKAKQDAAKSTPDGTTDPGNIDSVVDIKAAVRKGSHSGGPHDTTPLGTGKNWVTGVGGLPLYIREIAHALIRGGHSESNAVQIALGTVERWKSGGGNVSAETRMKAAKAWAEWLMKRAASHAKTVVKDSSRDVNRGKKKSAWDNSENEAVGPETKESEMGGTEDGYPQIEYKVASVQGNTVVDEDQGIVETIVSVTGLVDNVKDNIEPGVYGKALATRTPKGIWSHDWNKPISKTLDAKELMPGDPGLPKTLRNGDPWPKNAGALKIKTQFILGTTTGKDAFETVKAYGDQQEWSIGYQVPAGGSTVDEKTGVRNIKAIELYEYSPVLFGAMPQAVTQSVKSAQQAYHLVTFQRDDDGDYFSGETKKAFSPDKRRELARTGVAMPDGSFPIENEDDLDNAITSYGRSGNPEEAKKHIKKRAKALGKTGMLPETWQDDQSDNKSLDLAPADTSDYTDVGDESDTTDAGETIQVSAADINLVYELIDHLKDFVGAVTGQSQPNDNDEDDAGDRSAIDEEDLTEKGERMGRETKETDQKVAAQPHRFKGTETKCGMCGSGSDNWRHRVAEKTATVQNDSLADLVANLSDFTDDISNYDTLSSLAHQWDAAQKDGDKSLALDIGNDFLNELESAMDDAEESDAASVIQDIAQSYGEMLQAVGDGVHVPGSEKAKDESEGGDGSESADAAAEIDSGDSEASADGEKAQPFVVTKEMMAELESALNG